MRTSHCLPVSVQWRRNFSSLKVSTGKQRNVWQPIDWAIYLEVRQLVLAMVRQFRRSLWHVSWISQSLCGLHVSELKLRDVICKVWWCIDLGEADLYILKFQTREMKASRYGSSICSYVYSYLMSLLKKFIYLNGLQFVDTCNDSMDGCMNFRIVDLSDMHYGSVRYVQDKAPVLWMVSKGL